MLSAHVKLPKCRDSLPATCRLSGRDSTPNYVGVTTVKSVLPDVKAIHRGGRARHFLITARVIHSPEDARGRPSKMLETPDSNSTARTRTGPGPLPPNAVAHRLGPVCSQL